MKKRSYFFLILFIVMILFSVFVLVRAEPEEVTATSSDGILTVSGVTRESQPFIIETQESPGGNILFGSVYKVEPKNVVLDEPAVLSFENQEDLVIYKYDKDLELWSLVQDAKTIETNELGSFSLGYRMPGLDHPEFKDQFESMLKIAPKNTVGFEITAGYDFGAGPLIQVEHEILGGCDGVLQNGNTEELSKIDFGEYKIIARWFVSDVAPCEVGQDLKMSF